MPEFEPKAELPEDLDEFTAAYLVAAEWTGEYDDHPFPEEIKWGEGAIEKAKKDCLSFQESQAWKGQTEWSDEQGGIDFWLTRNGHGTGFWDRGWPMGDELSKECENFPELYVDEMAGTLYLDG